MIIVSQDKTKIINFENMEQIKIVKILRGRDEIKTFRIMALGQYEYEIGDYETEERAKEVLQEVIKEYRTTEITKTAINRLSDKVGALAIENVFVYQMPKD